MASRNQNRILTLIFAAALAWSDSTAAAADTVMLAPKHDAPVEAYVEFNAEVVQKMAGPDGKPMNIESHSTYGVLQKTTKKGDSLEIVATLDRLYGLMAFGEGMRNAYDTDESDDEDASPDYRDTFGPLLNMELKISVDSSGKAISLEGGDAIRGKLAAMGEQNFIAKGLSEGDFTDRQIMSHFGEFSEVLFPYREVKAGETWRKTRQDEYPHVGKIIVTYECKLEGTEKGKAGEVAIVTFKGTTAKDPEEKPAKDKRLGKIDGDFTGRAVFDIQQGRFIEILRDSEAKIEVPPWWSQDPEAPMMKIDSRTKETYTVSAVADRLKRKDEIAKRVADAKAKREAEEAAAMAGPVDPVTPENEAVAWLQWGGPDRNFRSSATGLANRWPKEGPPKLWERPLGDGFSAILCDGDALYTMYSIRQKDDANKGDEVVVALDAKTGKTLWEHKYAAPWPKGLQMEFGPGPHSTPIIVGDKLFTIGCTAKLLCLDKRTGSVLWEKDLLKDYNAGLHDRGYGSSPVAYKGNILLPVSKDKGHGIMAFSQADGAVAWKGGDFEPGYASLLIATIDGVDQIIAFTGKAVMGLDAANGNSQWSVEHPTQWGANITTPVWNPTNKQLFISAAYGMGSRGVQLENKDGKITGTELWFNPKMKIQHATAVIDGEWAYGSSGDFGPSFLASVNMKTGEFGWRQRGIAKANVLHADGKLIVLDEEGALFLVKADPEKYRLLGKALDICKKHAWTVPTLVGRTLYLRDREKIIALDLGERKENRKTAQSR